MVETNHASYPRNKNLAFAFYKAGFIESWGRGWQKICDGFQAAGLPKPTIESKQGGVLVTFQRNNVNLKMTDGRQIGSQTGTDVVDHVVEGVVEDGVEIPSARSIAMQLGTSPRTIQRELAYLQSQNIIIRRGNDYGGYWEIIE